MPYKEKTVERLYWSIGEVAEQMGVNTSLIRYWEKEFGMIRPKRTGRGDRMYTSKDIDLLKRIKASPFKAHVNRCGANLLRKLQRQRRMKKSVNASCGSVRSYWRWLYRRSQRSRSQTTSRSEVVAHIVGHAFFQGGEWHRIANGPHL